MKKQNIQRLKKTAEIEAQYPVRLTIEGYDDVYLTTPDIKARIDAANKNGWSAILHKGREITLWENVDGEVDIRLGGHLIGPDLSDTTTTIRPARLRRYKGVYLIKSIDKQVSFQSKFGESNFRLEDYGGGCFWFSRKPLNKYTDEWIRVKGKQNKGVFWSVVKNKGASEVEVLVESFANIKPWEDSAFDVALDVVQTGDDIVVEGDDNNYLLTIKDFDKADHKALKNSTSQDWYCCLTMGDALFQTAVNIINKDEENNDNLVVASDEFAVFVRF